jgi:hypothetical protein
LVYPKKGSGFHTSWALWVDFNTVGRFLMVMVGVQEVSSRVQDDDDDDIL